MFTMLGTVLIMSGINSFTPHNNPRCHGRPLREESEVDRGQAVSGVPGLSSSKSGV